MGWGLIMPGIGENSFFLSQPQLVHFEGGWEKVIRNSREQYFITCHFQFLISHRLHESIYLSCCLSVGFTILFSLRLHLLFHLFLVACTRLYNPLCRSVGPSVGPSVRPLVRHTLLFCTFMTTLRSF